MIPWDRSFATCPPSGIGHTVVLGPWSAAKGVRASPPRSPSWQSGSRPGSQGQGPSHDRIGPRVGLAGVAGRSERLAGPGAGDAGSGAPGLVVLGFAAGVAEMPGALAGSPSRPGPLRQHGPGGAIGGPRRGRRRGCGSAAYPPDPGGTTGRVWASYRGAAGRWLADRLAGAAVGSGRRALEAGRVGVARRPAGNRHTAGIRGRSAAGCAGPGGDSDAPGLPFPGRSATDGSACRAPACDGRGTPGTTLALTTQPGRGRSSGNRCAVPGSRGARGEPRGAGVDRGGVAVHGPVAPQGCAAAPSTSRWRGTPASVRARGRVDAARAGLGNTAGSAGRRS